MRLDGMLGALLLSGLLSSGFAAAVPARAQDWFRTGTGLGVNKPKVAVADFVSRNDTSTSLAALFSDVVRNDLDFSGIMEAGEQELLPHAGAQRADGAELSGVERSADFGAVSGVWQSDGNRHDRGDTGVVQRREKSFGAAGGGAASIAAMRTKSRRGASRTSSPTRSSRGYREGFREWRPRRSRL